MCTKTFTKQEVLDLFAKILEIDPESLVTELACVYNRNIALVHLEVVYQENPRESLSYILKGNYHHLGVGFSDCTCVTRVYYKEDDSTVEYAETVAKYVEEFKQWMVPL